MGLGYCDLDEFVVLDDVWYLEELFSAFLFHLKRSPLNERVAIVLGD